MSKCIAFLSNKLTLGGTEVAMYDYAHYNETILGNKSIIITRAYEDCKNEVDTHIDAYKKFENRFPVFTYRNCQNYSDRDSQNYSDNSKSSLDEIILSNKVDWLYILSLVIILTI